MLLRIKRGIREKTAAAGKAVRPWLPDVVAAAGVGLITSGLAGYDWRIGAIFMGAVLIYAAWEVAKG